MSTDQAISIVITLVPLVLMAWVARGQQKGDKNDERVGDLDKRVSVLEEHRQFLSTLMAKIDSRFDKLEAKLEHRNEKL